MFKKLIIMLLFSFAAASMAGAVSTLGPGDTVKINVYNHPDLATEAQISEKGTINFPLIGEVKVQGLTKSQAEDRIAHALDRGKYIPNPEVNILVTEQRSQQVAVLGEVKKPGKYAIVGSGSLTDMLAEAGGVTEKGGDQVMLLRRQTVRRIEALPRQSRQPVQLRWTTQRPAACSERHLVRARCPGFLHLRRSTQARCISVGARTYGPAGALGRRRIDCARDGTRPADQSRKRSRQSADTERRSYQRGQGR